MRLSSGDYARCQIRKCTRHSNDINHCSLTIAQFDEMKVNIDMDVSERCTLYTVSKRPQLYTTRW